MKVGDLVWTYQSATNKEDRSLLCRVERPSDHPMTAGILWLLEPLDESRDLPQGIFRSLDEVTRVTDTNKGTP